MWSFEVWMPLGIATARLFPVRDGDASASGNLSTFRRETDRRSHSASAAFKRFPRGCSRQPDLLEHRLPPRSANTLHKHPAGAGRAGIPFRAGRHGSPARGRRDVDRAEIRRRAGRVGAIAAGFQRHGRRDALAHRRRAAACARCRGWKSWRCSTGCASGAFRSGACGRVRQNTLSFEVSARTVRPLQLELRRD